MENNINISREEKAMVSIDTLRHSAAHVLAMALLRHNPKVKLAIGPSIENGFYYDADNLRLTEESLKTLEKSMKKIIKENLPFKKEIITKRKARTLFKDNKYKLEMLNALPGDKVSIYWTGKEFVDMCKGPHVKSTGEIKAVKLLKLAGAYWRGDEKNKMLTRIYGTAFASKKELDEFLKNLAIAETRDHKKLGKQLDLFSVHDIIGKGLPLLHPHGMAIRRALEDLKREVQSKLGLQEVLTPHIAKSDLWKSSGHYEAFKDDMYIFKADKKEHAVKPMNCPFHAYIYKSNPKSYRDLPYRLAEFAVVYRNEKAGELKGLLRVRALTQDDTHVFARKDQITSEVQRIVPAAIKLLRICGLKDVKITLSTKPEKSIGTDAVWKLATAALKKALDGLKLKYEVMKGEGAFYGPKIDIHAKDALGRYWQLTTVQLDFFMPTRFDLTYVDEKGSKVRPIMIHVAMYGSFERFMAVLIEHYGGAFPTWLAPVQVKLLNFTDRNLKYARKVEEALRAEGIRVEADYDASTIQKKVRNAELEKVPYVLCVGDKEQKAGTVAVRTRGKKKIDFGVRLSSFVKHVKKEIESRAIRP